MLPSLHGSSNIYFRMCSCISDLPSIFSQDYSKSEVNMDEQYVSHGVLREKSNIYKCVQVCASEGYVYIQHLWYRNNHSI